MEIMATVLSVSQAILIIGGALCMILLVIWLFIAIGIAMRISSIVRDVKMKYEMVQSMLLIPLQFVMTLLEKFTSAPTPSSSRKKR